MRCINEAEHVVNNEDNSNLDKENENNNSKHNNNEDNDNEDKVFVTKTTMTTTMNGKDQIVEQKLSRLSAAGKLRLEM